MTDQQTDLFDDEVKSEVEISTTVETETPETTETPEGEQIAVETPSTEEDQDAGKSEKMIPVHQFKAALKDVTTKLTAAEQELATLKAAPAPDRATDPEAYEQHVRIETSRDIMRATVSDYDETILHFQELAKENPMLNQMVANHPTPAKCAYDLAKKDIEINELSQLKSSDEWKEFQAFKAAKSLQGDAPVKKVNVTTLVPNLNRATSIPPSPKNKSSDDDELFKGAL